VTSYQIVLRRTQTTSVRHWQWTEGRRSVYMLYS